MRWAGIPSKTSDTEAGRGPVVSNTGVADGLHAMIVDEKLEHNGTDEFVWTEDKVTPFYQSS